MRASGHQWSSSLVVTVSSTHVVISQTVITPRPLPKKLALLVQPVRSGQVINVDKNEIVSFMVVTAILTVNLRRGISLLDVTVIRRLPRREESTWWQTSHLSNGTKGELQESVVK